MATIHCGFPVLKSNAQSDPNLGMALTSIKDSLLSDSLELEKMEAKWGKVKALVDQLVEDRRRFGNLTYPLYDLYKIQDKMRILDSE